MVEVQKRAPTLYVIIAMKLAKGLLLLLLAWGAYSLADKDLISEYRSLLTWVHLDPEGKFFTDLAARINQITPANVYWIATGAVLYSIFSLVEGGGLIARVGWAGWMAIGESSFFIPIEVYDLVQGFSLAVLVILLLNIVMVWYLVQNRHRLFRPHRA